VTAHRRIAREDAEAEAEAQALFAALRAEENSAICEEENDQALEEQLAEKEGTLGDHEENDMTPAKDHVNTRELDATEPFDKPVDKIQPQRNDSVQGALPIRRRGRRRATSRRQYPEDMLSWGA